MAHKSRAAVITGERRPPAYGADEADTAAMETSLGEASRNVKRVRKGSRPESETRGPRRPNATASVPAKVVADKGYNKAKMLRALKGRRN